MKYYNKKTIILGLSLIVIMTGVVIYVLKKQFNPADVKVALANAKIEFILIAAICMLLFTLGEAFNLMKGLLLSGHKIKLAEAVKYAFTGFFFSSITPSASGGQPAQLYIMKKNGIPLSQGSLALILELFGFECGSLGIGACGLAYVLVFNREEITNKYLLAVIILGFVANLVLLSCLIGIMFSRRAAKRIASISVGILSLFRENNEKNRRVIKAYAEYRFAASKLRKNRKLMMSVILISALRLTAYHSITYFVYRSLGLNQYGFAEITALQGLLFTAVSCIPLPGSTGAMEGGFGIVFKSVFSSGMLGSAIIITRIVSFAFPLIYSGIALLVITVRERKAPSYILVTTPNECITCKD